MSLSKALAPFPQKPGSPDKADPTRAQVISPPRLPITPGESADDRYLRTGGFLSLGHLAYALRDDAGLRGSVGGFRHILETYRECYKRVSRSASGLNEVSDPDGASAIPTDFATSIWRRTSYANLLDRITTFPILGTEFKMPADAESSRIVGSRHGGVRAYWGSEAAQYTRSRPTFSERYLRLKKVTALVYVTNELAEDASALGAYLDWVAPDEISFAINDALVNGDGVGLPLGMLRAGCKIVVAAEGGQAAATIVGANLSKMWGRLYAPSRPNAVWVVNQDCEDQLQRAAVATGSGAGQILYKPAENGSPYATINGRPIIPIEQCQTLGTEGDLILCDPTQILGIRKEHPRERQVSIHLHFDVDESVYKFQVRMDAHPAWATPLTPYKGTETKSPIVTLATRS